MIKVILFDCDGPIIKREKNFSQRLKEEKGLDVHLEKETSFFKGEFLECEIGKADLKEVLPKWLPVWGWLGTVDQLLDYWFEGETQVNPAMKNYIINLRTKGVTCWLATNNEKYRTEYLWNIVGLKSFLDGIFSSCYLGYMKPDAQYWEQIYKTLDNIPKQEVLVLDDKQSAIDSAKAFGFNAEFYTNFENFRNTAQEKYQIYGKGKI